MSRLEKPGESRRYLRPISSWTNLKSGLASKRSHCDLSVSPFPPIDENTATDFSRGRRGTIHTLYPSSDPSMIAVETMQSHINGMDGVHSSDPQEAEIMQGSSDSSTAVGVAFTTQEEIEANAAFNQQFREQQLAYQRAMQEQQEEQERQAAAARIIKTIEKPEDAARNVTGAQQPIQNRVFGLRKDLAGPSTEVGNYEHNQQSYSQGQLEAQDFSSTSQSSPSTSAPPLRQVDSDSSQTALPPSTGPKFSVEVIAPAFDKRGYPVFAGRGARIRGFLRTEALEGHEIVVKVRSLQYLSALQSTH